MSVRQSPYAFVAEVARYLAVAPDDVRRMIRYNGLPATRLPAATRAVHRIPLQDLHAWLLRRTPNSRKLALADYPTFLEAFRPTGGAEAEIDCAVKDTGKCHQLQTMPKKKHDSDNVTPPRPEEKTGLLNKIQAARVLAVKATTLEKLVTMGEIPVVRIGRCVRFRQQSLDLFCEARETRIPKRQLEKMRGIRCL